MDSCADKQAFPTHFKGKQILDWYHYQAGNGNVLYSVAELGNGNASTVINPIWVKDSWIHQDENIQPVPYRLPGLYREEFIHIVPDERTCKLFDDAGLFATCHYRGMNNWPSVFHQYFKKTQNVAIFGNNEDLGRSCLLQVARSLAGKVASVRVVNLPDTPEGVETSEWMRDKDPIAVGEELSRIIDGTPEYTLDPWEEQIYTLEEAFKPRPPRIYIVDRLVALPSLTIVYGPPGSLKSFIVADMCISVAAGQVWLSPLPDHGGESFSTTFTPVLWLDFDNGKRRTDERFEALAKARGLSSDVPLYYVSMPSPWLDSSNSLQMDELAARIKRLGVKLVVVDNLRLVSGNADENSAEMAAVMKNWRSLAESLGIAIIIIHHQRKGDSKQTRKGDLLRGHSSIEGSLDLGLLIERDEGSDLIRIRSTKVRGPEVPPFQAMFTYSHVPGTTEFESARFFGYEEEDLRSDWGIEKAVIATLRDHLKLYAPPNQKVLGVKVQKALGGKGRKNSSVGINRIRDILEIMESENKLIVTKGYRGAKLYTLPNIQ